jgi:hypothetical protein
MSSEIGVAPNGTVSSPSDNGSAGGQEAASEVGRASLGVLASAGVLGHHLASSGLNPAAQHGEAAAWVHGIGDEHAHRLAGQRRRLFKPAGGGPGRLDPEHDEALHL